jgi:UDP-N-acetylglucosamine 2-epimerase (non-hydrolysing)
MKILNIVGTRPEAVKMAPVLKELQKQSWCDPILLTTGQHRDLLDTALAEFEVEADLDLDLMQAGQSLGSLTGRAFLALEEEVQSLAPDMILAQGDTTTVMVAAMSAFYARVPFGHVEAGLRTGDRFNPFPEEINRVIVGRVADLHFAPTPKAAAVLQREGIDQESIFTTGNTVIDNLAQYATRIQASEYAPGEGERLILLTSHRRENFGEPMRQYFQGVRDIVDAFGDVRVVYPVHPNPSVIEAAQEILGNHARITLIKPLAYFDFMAMMQAADIIVTDSGGVQEEAPFFRKPVLVLREETERPEAVDAGVAYLVGTDRKRVNDHLTRLLSDPQFYQSMASGASPYGDGKASQRIVSAIADYLGVEYEGERLDPFGG